jgi:methyl-accepting chemotaxis protein
MTAVYREMFLKARFGIEGWSVVVTQPARIGLAAERRLSQAVWPVAIVALMSALLLALGAVRRTLGPLQALTEATGRLGERDFTSRIAVGSDNEFAVLGEAFNQMAEGLARQFDALDAHIQSMQRFIGRQRVMGYHRDNYLNIIRFTRKLTQLKCTDPGEVALLKNQVESAAPLSEKEWYFEMIRQGGGAG